MFFFLRYLSFLVCGLLGIAIFMNVMLGANLPSTNPPQDKLKDHCQSHHRPQHWMPTLVVQLCRAWLVQVLLIHKLEGAEAASCTY